MKLKRKYSHDELFRWVFGDPKRGRELIQTIIPAPVLACLDLETLRVEDSTYVDESLSRHFSDLVFTVGVKDFDVSADVYCLFEHKSAPARFVGLQLLRYMALRWTDCLSDEEFKGVKLPSIIPVVIYQGQKKWNVPACFQELIHFPSEEFKAYAPDFRFEFLDIPGLDDDRLEALKDKAAFHFYAAILKSLHSSELKKILPGLIEGLLETLESETAMDLVRIFIRYIIGASRAMGKEDVMEVLEKLPPEYEDIRGTAAEEWLKEGFEAGEKKGREEGELKNARRILLALAEDRFSVLPSSLLGKIDRIESAKTLNSLSTSVWRCDSLERFAELVETALV